jgi:exodeoxyribonuclease VII small subunit
MPRKQNEFEKAFQQLEEIVKRLESEELPLDDALHLFEQGIGLSRFCNQKLEEVEKKIELILADAKGQPRVEPFESGGAAAESDAEGDADEDDDAASEEGL